MPKVSIIVPIYNVEKYLRECLDSLINQTLKDIEIICVNDGSTDSSLKILEEYAIKDNRIILFDRENEGAGSARNYGLSKSNGSYLIFFDSDDYMAEDCLENLYNMAIANNSDITLCRSYRFNERENNNITDIDYSIRNDLLQGKQFFTPVEISKYIFQFCVGWPWDKLYKKEFIINNNLKFQNLRHSNDTYFVLMSLVFANLISYTNKHLVYHRCRNTSLANTRNEAPECFYYALKAMFKKLQEKNLYSIYKQSFVNYCVSFPRWHIDTTKNLFARNKMIKMHKKILREIKFSNYEKSYFYDENAYQLNCSQYSILQNIFSITNRIIKIYRIL